MELEEMKKGIVIIKIPDKIHSTYGIQIFKEDMTNIYNGITGIDFFIKKKLNEKFPNIRWFRQGFNSTWIYFEFWNGNLYQDEILQIAEEIAKHFNLPITIE